MFAHLTRHQGFFGEMNVLDNLWMSRVTSHVSLRTALDQITPERIDDALTLADRTMRGAGFATPRIAVCALNPHARRERAVRPRGDRDHRAGRAQGRRARDRLQGPVPVRHRVPQGLRRRVRRRAVDVPRPGPDRDQAQGLQPRRHRDRRASQTVFTTPAHGTAFDIVGKGVATTGALEQAVRLERAPCCKPQRHRVARPAHFATSSN